MITRVSDRRRILKGRVLLCRELIKLLKFVLDCGDTCNIFVCVLIRVLATEYYLWCVQNDHFIVVGVHLILRLGGLQATEILFVHRRVCILESCRLVWKLSLQLLVSITRMCTRKLMCTRMRNRDLVASCEINRVSIPPTKTSSPGVGIRFKRVDGLKK